MLLIESEAEFAMDPDGKAAEAEDQFTRALSLMSRASGEMWQFGVFGRARTRMRLGRFREAEEDLTILMDRNPSFGAAYYWRAKARESLGDADGAARDEEMARRLDSWPPLRDFMLETQTWNRDILCAPEVRAASHARNRKDGEAPDGDAVPAVRE
jgi:tetratricopeptide (TPR) repeat protein